MHTCPYHIMILPLGVPRKPYEMQSLIDCMTIRERVFIQEQQVPQEIDQDGKDGESAHVLLWHEDKPIGTLRYRITEEGVKMERIAILKEYRGRHLGRLLIREGLRAIRMNELHQNIYIHAQEHAGPFYTALGFRETGERTVEAGIAHITMRISAEQEQTLLDCDPFAKR